MVLRVEQASIAECIRDLQEVLKELDDHVLVDRILLGKYQRDDQHSQGVERHPGSAVRLLQRYTLGQVRTVDRADIVQAQEASAEQVVAVGVLPVQPPREVHDQFLEHPLQELAVLAAVDAVDPQSGHDVHRWIHIVEVPLVGRQGAVGVLEPLTQQHEQLVFREGRIQVRPGDRVEAQVPGGEPWVLPGVGHREHVEGVEVSPVAVAAAEASRRRRWVARVAVKPATDVVGVDLLAPDEPGAGLPKDRHALGVHRRSREVAIELLGVLRAGRDHGLEGPVDQVRGHRVGGAQSQAQLRRTPGFHRHFVAQRGLAADPLRVDGAGPVDHMVVDPVLREVRGFGAIQASHVGLVLAEQWLGPLAVRRWASVQTVPLEPVIRAHDQPLLGGRDDGPLRVGLIGPGVAEPQCR